ncbi:hypothetical protein RSOLAG22IIIB_07726 [Rhizoctonia solani]|uniref:Uncharacterized protein n=1 Tax=Rhizoctonia solani TaxID=456999 RepID=A0A0K6FPN5_9AGAM|nr:hypothetical protein RSOLAG22IIIB_07726 [Rhizoctonia solani]
MVESDAGADEVEQAFQEYREEILQLVEGWKLKIENDLVEIWGKLPVPNSGETGEARLKPQRRSPCKPKPKDELDAMCGSVLPECTVTFFDKDGSSVSSVESLSDHTSILLRATTTFHTIPNLLHRYYYPELLPSARSFSIPLENERPRLIDIWDPSAIVRDDDVSNTARTILERMGRPNATYPELKAMGHVFACQRPGCRLAPPMGWERFVGHYPFEQSRWKEARTKLRETSSRFVYNNTHDLSENNPQPLVKILNPTDAAKLEFERLDLSPGIDVGLDEYELMLCKICEQVGFEVWLMHTYIPSERSSVMEHLEDVHNVKKARVGVHYGPNRKNNE